jgi:hypothetical protein
MLVVGPIQLFVPLITWVEPNAMKLCTFKVEPTETRVFDGFTINTPALLPSNVIAAPAITLN